MSNHPREEDPNRDGLNRTPERVARMYDELLIGYTIDPDKFMAHLERGTASHLF
ncbi:MAG: GTP cyclohydrolase I [Candidatus Bipolaricaulia bacterium]